MYLLYLPEASYMYSPANHYLVLKRYSLIKFFVCLGFFFGGGGGNICPPCLMLATALPNDLLDLFLILQVPTILIKGKVG